MSSWHRAAVVPTLVCLLAGLGVARGAWGQVFRLDSSPPDCDEQSLDLAALPGGGLVAVWQAGSTALAGSPTRIFARLFDAHRAPRGPEFQVNGESSAFSPAVAVGLTGDILIVWGESQPQRLLARLYNATGAAAGPEVLLGTTFPRGGAAVTATPEGFAVVAAPGPEVRLWRLDLAGAPVGPSEVITTTAGIPDAPFPVAQNPAVAYSPDGLVVAWAEDHLAAFTVFAVLRTTDNTHLQLSPQPSPTDADDPHPAEPAVAVDGTGRILVAWNESPSREPGSVRAQVFGRGGAFLGEAVYVDAEVASDLEVSAPDAAGLAEGFVVAWESQDTLFPGIVWHDVWLRRVDAKGAIGPTLNAGDSSSISRPSLTADEQERLTVGWQAGAAPSELEGPTCFSHGLYAVPVRFASSGLLLQGRFEAQIVWTDHAGHTGTARGVPLTNDSGYFWFFAENNVEVMVKVLDGRVVNGHFWVFYGSLSDVAFTLTVTDTVTGLTKSYANPAGRLASSADTLAFPAVLSSSAASVMTAAVTADLAVAPQPSHVPPNTGAGPCAPPETVSRRPGLCLGKRFEVEVAWHANGTEGIGQGTALTADSGTLWFFGPNNVELVVKVLDGRAVNGHFWVFFGALSDVEYTVLVRDSLTGIQRTYHNPAGRLRSHADTAAF